MKRKIIAELLIDIDNLTNVECVLRMPHQMFYIGLVKRNKNITTISLIDISHGAKKWIKHKIALEKRYWNKKQQTSILSVRLKKFTKIFKKHNINIDDVILNLQHHIIDTL